MWQDPVIWESLIVLLLLSECIIVVRDLRRGIPFQDFRRGEWPGGILLISFSVALGVLLYRIHPGATFPPWDPWAFLIVYPGIIYAERVRHGLLKRNRALHFIALGLLAFGVFVVLAHGRNLPQPLTNSLYLLGVLLILAGVTVTYQEATRLLPRRYRQFTALDIVARAVVIGATLIACSELIFRWP